MAEINTVFESPLIQFEDFSINNSLYFLQEYRNDYKCFNDDIQGTGGVVAAGLLNAIKIAAIGPSDLKVLILGAGSSACGVYTILSLALSANNLQMANFIEQYFIFFILYY